MPRLCATTARVCHLLADPTADTLPGARNVPASEVVAAKYDGRLPMEDHNTRIVVFGADAEQARNAADVLAANAFHNVTFYAGSAADLLASIAARRARDVGD
jgi:rhodanese-related sulfurtransferase